MAPIAGPFITDDREAAFKHFAPLVAATPEDLLEAWHYDAEILRGNLVRCDKALAPHLDAMTKTMPHIDMDELRELPTLGNALAFAAAQILPPTSAKDIHAMQAAQRPRRRVGLMMLEVLNEMGLLADPTKLDAIGAGRGPIALAQDGVTIVSVFHDNAATVKGKHPFDDAWLQELADDSNWLLAQLKPGGVKADKPVDHAAKPPQVLARDQLFTEIVRRYEQARKVAIEVWGFKSFEKQFPALTARATAPKAAAAAAPATPANGAATPGAAPADGVAAPAAATPEPSPAAAAPKS